MPACACSPRLLAAFADDHPQVAAAALQGARLSEMEWLELMPALTPTGRAMLRHRRDLPAGVVDALAGFGSSDFVIGSDVIDLIAEPAAVPPPEPTPAPPPAAAERPSQIRELVERIEAFQRHRHDEPKRRAEAARPTLPLGDRAGRASSLGGGAPRGPLIGQSIAAHRRARAARSRRPGRRRVRRRAPFRDARFSVAGEGGAAGDWRISGVPFSSRRAALFSAIAAPPAVRASTRKPPAAVTRDTRTACSAPISARFASPADP